MENNKNLNDLSKKHSLNSKKPSPSKPLEQPSIDKLQYEYLKNLNDKLILFKKAEQEEKDGQTLRR